MTFVFILLFFFLVLFFFVLVQVNAIVLAFIKIGIPTEKVFATLIALLLGSFINIPIKKIPQEIMVTERRINFFGLSYMVPVWRRKMTVVAVNVGGALIPTLISLYLLIRTGLYLKASLATLFMTLICFKMAKPIRGIGIALPFFVPPALAALFSLFLAYKDAPVIAYISGTLGTLIGADILNLKKIGNLGAPVASIGGAGTFDGIFLTGVLAVLLSVFFT